MNDLSQFVIGSQPESSKRSYATYQKQYKEYCVKQGWDPLSVTNRDVYAASFMASRAEGKGALAHTTLLGPVSGAIFDLFRLDPFNPTASPVFREMKKAVKRVAPAPRGAKEPLPLSRLREAIVQARKDKNHLNGWRDVCIMLIMYTAFLRQSEVVALKVEDIKFTEETVNGVKRRGVSIHVRKAKNDQERKGSDRPVPEFDGDPFLCPYKSLRKYLTLRDQRNPMLFYNPRVPLKWGARAVGPALASTTPTHILRHRLQQAGVPELEMKKYASNSLRKGGATNAFSAGVSKLTIKRHGAWRSDAVDSYITVPVAENWKLVESILRGDDDGIDSDDD